MICPMYAKVNVVSNPARGRDEVVLNRHGHIINPGGMITGRATESRMLVTMLCAFESGRQEQLMREEPFMQ